MRKCKHIIIIGMDGAGTYVRDADTPNMDKIFGDGAVSYRTLTSRPTGSTECWCSALTGTGTMVHGMTNETCLVNVSKRSSIFSYVRNAYPDAVLGSILEWYPPNSFVVEEGIGVYKKQDLHGDELYQTVINFVEEQKPTLLYVHIDKTDLRGHKYGYGTAKHYETITECDSYIGEIYEAAQRAGMTKENTVFISLADHGGSGFVHGGWNDPVKYVFMKVAGCGIQNVDMGDINIRDMAAIVLHALDIPLPEYDEKGWTAQVPKGLFADGSGDNYKPVVRLHQNLPEILPQDKVAPPFDSEKGLGGVFGEKAPILALMFDASLEDETGHFPARQVHRNGDSVDERWIGCKGIRRVRGGVRGNCILCNGDGYMFVPGLNPGSGSFTAAFWLHLDDSSYVASQSNILFSTKTYGDFESDGCSLQFCCDQFSFRADVDGVNSEINGFVMPDEFDGGWLHVIVSVDRERRTVRVFNGFREIISKKGEMALSKKLDGKSFDGTGNLRIGFEETRCMALNDQYMLDDFLWFDRAFDEKDVEILRKYYL